MLSPATRASVLLSLPTKHQFLFAQKVRDLAEVKKRWNFYDVIMEIGIRKNLFHICRHCS